MISMKHLRTSPKGNSRLTYLSKMYFIENDFVGMVDAPEPGQEGNGRYNEKSKLVIPF